MIDVHSHLLPYLDDGAVDWDASLEMARTYLSEQVSQCVATPHWTGAPGETDLLRERAQEFHERAREAGIPLKLHLGNEVILVPQLVDALKAGTALTLAGSSYILLETAHLEQGAYIQQALFQIQSNGYRIILAHPERVHSWQERLGALRDLVQRGCFLQVNAGSLTGGFGRGAQRTAEQLLQIGWVSLLATDAHGPTTRAPLLGPALKRCVQLIGEEAAMTLVHENPARVLCDEQLPYIDFDAIPKRSFLRWSWPPWR